MGQEVKQILDFNSISDLHNYSEVLHDTAMDPPALPAENSCSKYAILDIQGHVKNQAAQKLMGELTIGRKSGESEGWLTPEDVREHFFKGT